MTVQRDGTGLASAARIVANYTFPIETAEHSGIFLIVDVTLHNGGTVSPSILVPGDGANSGIAWTGSALSASNQCQGFCVYPQGLNVALAAGQAEVRGLALPDRYTVQMAVTVATVTFSVHYYLLPA